MGSSPIVGIIICGINIQKAAQRISEYNQCACDLQSETQLNRNIESPDRISNPVMHYPKRSDVFASDSIFHASDYMMVIHRPEVLHIEDGNYGPSHLPTKDLVYLHILKNRDGEAKVLMFKNNLKYNSIDEISINEL